MSYPPLSGYYDFSGRPSMSGSDVYPNRDMESSMYAQSVSNGTTAASAQVACNNPAYEWTGQAQPRSHQTRNEYGNSSWAQSVQQTPNKTYGTGSSYTQQDPAGSAGQSQSHYAQGRQAPGRARVVGQDMEGLTNLAYASGLESTRSRPVASQQYNNGASVQPRMRRTPETQSQYSTEPPSISQTLDIPASERNRQLAMNTAAALAGAASRGHTRNPSQIRDTTAISSTYPSASVIRRTVSPRGDNQSDLNVPETMHERNTTSTAYLSQRVDAQHRNSPSGYETSSNNGKVKPQNAHTARQPPNLPRNDVQGAVSISNILSVPQETPSTGAAGHPHPTEVASSYIDPSQVFNPYHREHEQRRERVKLAEAEAKRKAEEETIRRRSEAERTELQTGPETGTTARPLRNSVAAPKRQRKPKANKTQQAGKASTSIGTEEENMAAELKAMMDKMKTFRSKDPNLFQKLWSDMRQEPSANITTSEGPSPRPAQRGSPDIGPSVPETGNAAERAPIVQQQPRQSNGRWGHVDHPVASPSPKTHVDAHGTPVRLNGYKVVIENNVEGLPDLGRFPAERRVRHKYNPRTGKKIDGTDDTGQQQEAEVSQDGDSGTVPLQVAVPKKGTTTIWPLDKRAALTSAALKSLKAIEANAKINLTEDDIYQMLDKNPTYLGLCQLLEAKGVTLNKGQFARELLNSVPDLIAQPKNRQAKGALTSSTVETAESSSQLPRNATVLPGQLPSAAPSPSDQSGFSNTFQPVNPPLPPAVATSKAKKPVPPYSCPEPPPGSKEAAAKKRSLAELIDLTELDNNENYVTPSKFARMDETDEEESAEPEPFRTWQKPVVYVRPEGLNSNSAFGRAHRTNVKAQALTFNAQPWVQQSGQQHAQQSASGAETGKMILAKSLDRTEAMRKTYYDPKTIARDVLITSGRHIFERPLNVHLAGILGKYIELDSDVSTFEWDEIDPGGPAPPQVAYADVLVARPRFKIGERTGREPRGPRGPRRAIVDETRQPETETRSGATPPATAASAPVSANKPVTSSLRASRPSVSGPSLLAASDQATPATLDPTRLAPPTGGIQTTSKQSTRPAHVQAQNGNMATPPVKRRGRPPGSKNKYAKLGDFKEMGAKMSVMDAPPPPSQAAMEHRFKCRWKECSVVLHNLDTLRKHIGKIHRPTAAEASSDGYTCWWRHCQYLVKDENGDLRTSQMFTQWSEWLKHIEKEHITPLGQKWGDGPSTKHIDPRELENDRKRYLSNAQHQQVTPAIDLDHAEAYTRDMPNLTKIVPFETADEEKEDPDAAAYRAYLKAHGVAKDSRAASELVVEALKRRKWEIGAGIEKGGCTFITQGIRDGFVSAPNVRRVVDEKY